MGKVARDATLVRVANALESIAKTQADFSDYRDIQALVRAGLAKESFNIGDQLVVPYTATNGTTYDMPFDVVDFRDVTLENGDVVPGMVLQSHYATLEAVQFDAPETTRPASDDYNGQIAQYGWGRWAKSGIRQWLNSAEPAGHWWTPQNDYDEAPTQHATVNGFMHGLPSDFLAVLKPVKVETARDYRYPAGGSSGTYVYDTTYDKFFLTSKEEEYTVVNEPNHREGLPFQYWIERLTPEATIKGEPLPQNNYASADNTYALTSHIRYALENHTSAQSCRLRSAYRSYASYTWSVYHAGYVSSTSASSAYRCAPACVIC